MIKKIKSTDWELERCNAQHICLKREVRVVCMRIDSNGKILP